MISLHVKTKSGALSAIQIHFKTTFRPALVPVVTPNQCDQLTRLVQSLPDSFCLVSVTLEICLEAVNAGRRFTCRVRCIDCFDESNEQTSMSADAVQLRRCDDEFKHLIYKGDGVVDGGLPHLHVRAAEDAFQVELTSWFADCYPTPWIKHHEDWAMMQTGPVIRMAGDGLQMWAVVALSESVLGHVRRLASPRPLVQRTLQVVPTAAASATPPAAPSQPASSGPLRPVQMKLAFGAPKWTCSVCTFVHSEANQFRFLTCAMCSSPRG